MKICRQKLSSSTKLKKTGRFTSKKAREQLRNVDRGETHVQSVQKYCFLLLNMQILLDVLVSFVVVLSVEK